MKNNCKLPAVLLIFVFTLACNAINLPPDAKSITPSNNIITETRDVSGSTGIDFRTFGEVVITQGETESVTIKGSDNVVPVIQTSVRDGVLVIQHEENINLTGMNDKNTLTFTIVVKDLISLTVSGAGNIKMDSLSTSKMEVVMSGAGNFELGNLKAQSLNVTISGVGNVNVAGEATHAWINISGAGPVNTPDLKIQTADVTISGIGSATLWVTDELTGTISGAGNVRYYGDPKTNVNSTGIGKFEALGAK